MKIAIECILIIYIQIYFIFFYFSTIYMLELFTLDIFYVFLYFLQYIICILLISFYQSRINFIWGNIFIYKDIVNINI